MSRGFYNYIDPDFKPGTIPERFNLVQNGLPIPVRDLNFYNYDSIKLIDGAAVFENTRVFRICPQTGFDPGSEMSLQMNFNIKKNHLITDSTTFIDKHQLPLQLFERQELQLEEIRDPAWVTIWRSRIPEVVVLLIALTLLSYIFIRWSIVFFTLFFIGFYAQGQLSVVNVFTLLLELLRGFDIAEFCSTRLFLSCGFIPQSV